VASEQEVTRRPPQSLIRKNKAIVIGAEEIFRIAAEELREVGVGHMRKLHPVPGWPELAFCPTSIERV
jgi:hypothetical protein